MARTAPKQDDKDGTQPAARSGWLRTALQMLFVRQWRGKRSDGKPVIAHDQRSASGHGRHAAKVSGTHVPSEHVMHNELSALLKAAPGSREALRHLAAVLHGLRHKDPKGLFLFRAEPAHVRTALRQLDGLMPKEPTIGLAALRARMVDAVENRERRAKRLAMLSARSDPMQSDHMEVREASATEFDRALQR